MVTGVNLVNKMESCSSVELLDLVYKESSLAVTIDLLEKKKVSVEPTLFYSAICHLLLPRRHPV